MLIFSLRCARKSWRNNQFACRKRIQASSCVSAGTSALFPLTLECGCCSLSSINGDTTFFWFVDFSDKYNVSAGYNESNFYADLDQFLITDGGNFKGDIKFVNGRTDKIASSRWAPLGKPQESCRLCCTNECMWVARRTYCISTKFFVHKLLEPWMKAKRFVASHVPCLVVLGRLLYCSDFRTIPCTILIAHVL